MNTALICGDVHVAGCGCVRALSDFELVQAILTVRAKIPAAYQAMIRKNTQADSLAFFELQAEEDMLVAERLRRIDCELRGKMN